jgi:hypothetical protein
MTRISSLAVDERAGADDLGDALVAGRLGNALGHHEGDGADGIAERVDDEAGRLLQRQHESFRIRRLERGCDREDATAERAAGAPAAQRRHAIGRRDRLAIMPFQSVAQREAVGQAIGRDFPVLHHLRLDIALGILREQRVEHHVAERARNIGRGKMRIERDDLRLEHRDEIACRMRRRQRRSRHQREGEQRRNESLQFGHWCLFAFFGARLRSGRIRTMRGNTGVSSGFKRQCSCRTRPHCSCDGD